MNNVDYDQNKFDVDSHGNLIPKNLNPQTNGFENMSAECEGLECEGCNLLNSERREIDCPYVPEQ